MEVPGLNNQSVLEELTSNDVFKQFLQDDIDIKSVASTAVQGVSVSEQLAKLSAGISLLDKAIHDQVGNHYEDLLSQATGIETLEEVLQMMHSRIQTLMLAAERLRAKIVEPYNRVACQTAMLSRLQVTCDLLRCIIRILHLSQRLQGQLQGGAQSITKAAQSLNELDYLMEGVDLSGIKILEKDQQLIKDARRDVEHQANVMLEKGMKNQHQTQVATALQVFHNLQILTPTVQQTVESHTNRLQQSVQKALDVRNLIQQPTPLSGKGLPGRVMMPVIGDSAEFRATLWTNMNKLMDEIYSTCSQIQHLQKVLTKQRDPVSHSFFVDELKKNGQPNIMRVFWNAVTQILLDSFTKAANDSTFTRQAFEGQYPKLLRLYTDLWKRLQQFSSSLVSVMPADNGEQPVSGEQEDLFKDVSKGIDPEQQLRNTLANFEKAYLSQSLSRLFDSVNLIFPDGSREVPTDKDIDGIVKTISSEMNAAADDALLCQIVAKNVGKTVNLFANKCELLISTDQEATQIIDPPMPGQRLNAQVMHLHCIFEGAIEKFLQGITAPSPAALNVIQNSLQPIVMQMENAIHPFTTSVINAIEAIIATVHQEDFSGPVSDEVKAVSEAQCSLYMKELQKFILRAQNDYFSLYPDCELVQKRVQQIASRAIELFIRHTTLIRPLGDKGKMRLAADFAQMEMAVLPLCPKIGDLGKAYKMLRSFRPLLFQTPAHVAKSPVLGDIVPYSMVLQFLFSRAPPELRSPHEASTWSIEYYSQWLDKHSEKERLALIRVTLESYVKLVKQRHEKEFCPVYPVMVELLQRGMEAKS